MADAPQVQLRVNSVSVRFGGIQAVRDVDLSVAAGVVTGLIGPNGAGKTTLFNVITGLQTPTKGNVSLGGRDVTRFAPYRRARLGLARTFQRLELFGTLTARENVQLALETKRARVDALPGASNPRFAALDTARSADDLLAKVGVPQVANEPADLLPTGLARLVELARALATAPSVLLLDEPSAGLDETETDALGTVLQELAESGMAVLLVEHDMRLVMNVCQHVAVMDGGAVIAEGDPAAIQRDPLVQEAYLGESKDEESDVDSETLHRPPSIARTENQVEGEHVLELSGIHAGYGRIEVVHDVSLSLRRGSVLALLGPNGAGKSTLLKVASGQIVPMSGRVLLHGKDVTGQSPERLVRLGLCAVPEGRAVFPNLTVQENLRMYTYGSGKGRSQDLEEQSFERFPVLRDRRRQIAGRLSGGEQQALGLARALCSGARVLLVDELSMGLAPLIVADLYERVARLVSDEGVSVVLVEQFAKMALGLADEAAILVNGRIVRRGTPEEMEPELVRSYMGEVG